MPYADKQSEVARESQRRASRKYYGNHREAEVSRCAKWNRENKEAVNANAVKRRNRAPLHKVLYNNAMQRARKYGIEFTISFDDIVVPEFCPVLGLRLVIASGAANDSSPSLDRKNPLLGYVPGNVQVISHKANTIKSNGSIADLRAVLTYMERTQP